jgi:uncharacterized protein (TIGR00255 family)
MNSMTGFGRADLTTKFGSLTVEVSSVNGRYLEISARLPRPLAALESRVRDFLSSQLTRGQISVFISFGGSNNGSAASHINKVAAAVLVKELRALKKEHKLVGDVTLHDLLLVPDVVESAADALDLDQMWKSIEKGLTKAVSDLLVVRKKDGQSMAADMKKRLDVLIKTVQQVEKKSANSVQVYRDKLADRINTLLTNQPRENLRLEEEITIFAERTDITEEITRFKSHIELYRDTLGQKEPSGKRLNFILQEMNREANTIGSKCADFDVSNLAITLKEEIEKLRELVQNVE